MTARNERPREEKAAAQETGRRDSPEIGWGLKADETEDMGRREWVFRLSTVLVVCIGAWILLTSVLGGGDSKPVLSTEGSVSPDGQLYTVKLREFGRSELAAMRRICSTPQMRALAEGNSFRMVELSDDRLAVCVGEAEQQESAELRRLLANFEELETRGGERPFRSAEICISPG